MNRRCAFRKTWEQIHGQLHICELVMREKDFPEECKEIAALTDRMSEALVPLCHGQAHHRILMSYFAILDAFTTVMREDAAMVASAFERRDKSGGPV
jgi:cobalamin biosynthesis Co2+ chelatase CbiK